MADVTSSRAGRGPGAALLALCLLTLGAGHLHVCSGEATLAAATTPLDASAPAAAASARVVISESPSNTQAVAGAGVADGVEVQSSAPPAPPSRAAAPPTGAGASATVAAPRPARSVPPSAAHAPPELELESAADADRHLETNEVGVGNTAGRYFHGIRPTRPVGTEAGGGSSVVVTSTAGTGEPSPSPSGEEQGASRAGGRGPPLSPTPIASSAATAREEKKEEEEEEQLVRKIWTIAQGDGSPPAAPQEAGGTEGEEARGRGRGRALGDAATPASLPAAPANATGRSEERKTNPDIQDIITGIVKLLNGNVKVQANTNLGGPVAPGARPPRPMATRINNRGPPRITDLPPLPPLDLDAPPAPGAGAAPGPGPGPGATASTRLPPPYPFDRPMGAAQGPGPALPPQPPGHSPNAHPFVNGVPLPEQVVPVAGQRPPPPPQRPRPPQQRPRPPPSRRPPPPPPPPGLPPQPLPQPQPPPPPPPARPQPDDVPVIPVTFHAFELLPSTGAADLPPPPPPDTTHDDDAESDGVGDGDASAEDDAAAHTGEAEQGDAPTTPPPPPPPPSPPPSQHPSPPPSPPPPSPSPPPAPSSTTLPPPPAPQPKPEKDVKKPLESSKEKEAPPKAQPTRGASGGAARPTLAPSAASSAASAAAAEPSASEGPETNVMGGAPAPSAAIRPTAASAAPAAVDSTAVAVPERPVEEPGPSPDPGSVAASERPLLLEPSTGVGVAEPVLESSMQEESAGGAAQPGLAHSPPASPAAPTAALPAPGYSYRPRPGLVLDDPEYKPAGGSRPLGLGLGLGLGAPPPIVTAPAARPGEVFDVTVSAVQGPDGGGGGVLHTGRPYVYPVELPGPEGAQGSGEVITSPQRGQHFVSIDGKRTYINLMGQPTARPGGVHATRPLPPGAPATRPAAPPALGAAPAAAATGPALPAAPTAAPAPAPPGSPGSASVAAVGAGASVPAGAASPARPPPFGGPRRPAPPAQPPVRIDTCIVGDASTCDEAQHERCRTEHGVSACHCRPGYSRRKHREPCRRIVSMLMSLRVDRLYERRVVWSSDLQDPSSEMYQQLQWEASRAVDSAMSMTPFSDDFLGARVNGVYAAPGTAAPVFVNLTLQLEETAETLRPAVRHDVQRHLLGVIHRRANNVGESALWVDAPAGAVSHLQDVDECARPELHDCHPRAVCSNVFGGFRCACEEGLRDPWGDQPARAGRACEPCPPEHCGGAGRGACHYDAQGQPVCTCTGNFYGAQCEVDGEVLGVAVGASVAAVVIIALTLVCLCMWSRRWQREQKAAVGSPVFGYLGAAGGTVKTPAVGGPPYQVSLEDRLRWAQIADVMAQANHYSTPLACHQPEPGGTVPTRPSSAVFGYPALPAALTATLPPAPLPRLGLHGLLPAPPAPASAPPPPPAPSTRAGSGARTIDNCSSGDDEDRADLLGGRSFHVPRPKSRSSVANQSGIYYDVDYDQSDIYGTKHPSIPMNTYASRGSYHRQ